MRCIDELEIIKAMNKELNAQVIELHAKIATRTAEMEGTRLEANKEIALRDEKLQEANEMIMSRDEKLSEACELSSSQGDTILEFDRRYTRLNADFESRNREFEQCYRELDELKRNNMIREIQEEITPCNDTSDIRNENDTLRRKNSELNTRVAKLRAKVVRLGENLVSTNKALAQRNEELEQFYYEMDGLKERVAVQEIREVKDSTIDELRKEIKALKKTQISLKDTLLIVQRKNKVLNDKSSRQGDFIHGYQHDTLMQGDEIKALQEKNEKQKARIKTLQEIVKFHSRALVSTKRKNDKAMVLLEAVNSLAYEMDFAYDEFDRIGQLPNAKAVGLVPNKER